MTQEQLTLQKYTTSDFCVFNELVQSDLLMKYITGKALTLEQAHAKFDAILQTNNQCEELGYFKIFNDQKQFIGDCKLEWNKDQSDRLEVGYILKEAFWGKGYATKICAELVQRAQGLYKGTTIMAIIDPANVASRKILQKNGFTTYFVGVQDNLPTEKLILEK